MASLIDRVKGFMRPTYYALLRKNRPTFTRNLARMGKYYVGEWTYGSPKVYDWNQGSTLRIGRFCSIAGGVQIFLGGNHRQSWVSTYPFAEIFSNTGFQKSDFGSTKGNVTIGNDVWIGHEALILSGVTIGDGAVIAARSVVTHDVLPYAVVAGNPAEFIRFRFNNDAIAALVEIAWWDWPIADIQAKLPFILSDDIGAFIQNVNEGVKESTETR